MYNLKLLEDIGYRFFSLIVTSISINILIRDILQVEWINCWSYKAAPPWNLLQIICNKMEEANQLNYFIKLRETVMRSDKFQIGNRNSVLSLCSFNML